jgi:hypothetical protein
MLHCTRLAVYFVFRFENFSLPFFSEKKLYIHFVFSLFEQQEK